ncbi:DUF1190 domain-containing protein [Paracoccus pacificus]|uniref:DUF1190 domain-containing protein n=1 Tax=Paracoccus pacificus TaxID=1463598 RepID=A0ABW4RB59_9RHOB
MKLSAKRSDPPAPPGPPRRKRSRRAALFLAGATVLTLSACEEDKVDAEAFPDLQSCITASKESGLWFTEEDCRTQFAEAEKTHLETAPRYESLALCEEEHGKGNCGGDPAAEAQPSQGGGFSFMPLLVGYMMGSMLSGGGRGVFSQPMVRTAQGGFSTPSGNQTFATNSGKGAVPASTFQKAPSTIGKAPMTRAQVASRGGFGASRSIGSGGTRSVGS